MHKRHLNRTLVLLLIAQLSFPSVALASPLAQDVLPQFSLSVATTPDSVQAGWVHTSDGWRYYDPLTLEPAQGWRWIDGAWYHFAEDGLMHTGWLCDEGTWYWLGDGITGSAGAMQRNGWLLQGGVWYWLNADGSMKTGWLPLGGSWYYFDLSGAMRTGWLCDRGLWYWLTPDSGAMATGWIHDAGTYYPLDADGHWVTAGDIRPAGDADRVANLSESQRAVLWACDNTPFPGASLCAGWVSGVFENAGLGGVYGNACDVVSDWCYSSNVDDLRPGMILGVESHTRTVPGQTWGHVGIYIGGGKVRDSATAGLRQVDLGSWIAWYGTTYDVRWGWANGRVLAN